MRFPTFGPVLILLLGMYPRSCLATVGCVDYATYAHWVASIDTPGCTISVAISGNNAFVAERSGVLGDSTGLTVIDITHPTQPRFISRLTTPGDVGALVLSGSYAYVTESPASTNRWSGLQIIDITDPEHLRVIGSLGSAGRRFEVMALAVSGTRALRTAYDHLAGSSVLEVVNIVDPARPFVQSRVRLPGLEAYGIAVVGDIAYVANGDHGLVIIDIGSTHFPRLLGIVPLPWRARDVKVSGAYAYVAVMTPYAGSLQVLDISDPNLPVLVSSVETRGQPYVVTVEDNYAYLPMGGNGLDIVDVTDPEHPRIVGSVRTPDYPTCVAVAGDYAFVTDYDEGLAVLDVSNRSSVPILGSIDTPGQAHHVVVSGAIAYVADLQRLVTIDISDPTTPILLGMAYLYPGEVERVRVSENLAYVAAGASGLVILDVTDPESPAILGRLDAAEVGDVAVSGGIACLAARGDLVVVDVSEPRDPQAIGSVMTPGFDSRVAISGSYAFSGGNDLSVIDISDPHALRLAATLETGNLSDFVIVDRYLYTIAYRSFQVIDIADPEHPQIVGRTTAEGMSLTVAGRYAYAEGDWVQVIDIMDPRAPVQVGNVLLPQLYPWSGGVAVGNGVVCAANNLSGLQILPIQCEPGADEPIGVEDSRPAISAEAGPVAFPNPGIGWTSIRFVLPPDNQVEAEIYDIGGRHVRTLRDGSQGDRNGGACELLWDGRDDRGRQVARGMYLARIKTASGMRTTRIVIER